MTVVAGAGSNDTRHAVHMTERATELGADAILSVTPYYNRPNRRGSRALRGGRRGDRQADRALQHPVPHGAGPAQRPAGRARAAPRRRLRQAGQRRRTSRPSTGCRSTRATTTCSPRSSTSGALEASWWPVTWSATPCAAWWTSPTAARRSTLRSATSTRPSGSHNPIRIKAALNMMGLPAGGPAAADARGRRRGQGRGAGDARAPRARRERPPMSAGTRPGSASCRSAAWARSART